MLQNMYTVSCLHKKKILVWANFETWFFKVKHDILLRLTRDTMQVVQVMIKETIWCLFHGSCPSMNVDDIFFWFDPPNTFLQIWDMRDNVCRSGVRLPSNDTEQWFWTVKWESRQASKRHLEHLWENLGQSVHNNLMKKTGLTTQKQETFPGISWQFLIFNRIGLIIIASVVMSWTVRRAAQAVSTRTG